MVSEVLLGQETIEMRVEQLAQQIQNDYQGKGDLVLVCVLKGAFVFCSDLARHLTMPVEFEFVAVSSYGNDTVSSGEVKIELPFADRSGKNFKGKHLLIVEDILDSGRTAEVLIKFLHTYKPSSVAFSALLRKPTNLKFPINVDYLGFDIPDKYVIGHGLDYAGKFRNWPSIGVLDTSLVTRGGSKYGE
ncbi:MAG: hypoxanthine phosphoribosyltransferase [Oligoflexia bacterium]|nr:hypoxanthine phosphoribosyltransferase [Oligoflexia bacterium]